MIQVNCPNCQGNNLTDLPEGTIYPEEIKQDFACDDCGAHFTVTYAPISLAPFTPEE